ncbi:MAG: hypothetical protein ABH877_04300 [bacterium]
MRESVRYLLYAAVILLAAASILIILSIDDRAEWSPAPHAAAFDRRTTRVASVLALRQTTTLKADLDVCHRKIEAIDATIVVIENRRGNDPPRTLEEQRLYQRPVNDWSMP